MADCCLIKKVATVEVYENKNEVRAYGFMAGDRNTPVMEVRFKHLWGESNLSSCKLRWIIVDDVGSLLVGEVPITSDNTALINLPNELFTGDRRMKVQLTVASCDGERILNLQQFTDLKVINSLAPNEVVEPVYQMLINTLYDESQKYLNMLETSYTNKYGSLEGLYLSARSSLENYLITAENGGNAEFVQGYAPANFNRVEGTVAELQASNKYKLGDVVEVLGYYEKGDGAGHPRKASNADDGSGVQGQNGIWWNVVHNGEVNVSWFGAKGDGTTDDTIAIQKSFLSSANIICGGNKTYFITSVPIPKGIAHATRQEYGMYLLEGKTIKNFNFKLDKSALFYTKVLGFYLENKHEKIIIDNVHIDGNGDVADKSFKGSQDGGLYLLFIRPHVTLNTDFNLDVDFSCFNSSFVNAGTDGMTLGAGHGENCTYVINNVIFKNNRRADILFGSGKYYYINDCTVYSTNNNALDVFSNKKAPNFFVEPDSSETTKDIRIKNVKHYHDDDNPNTFMLVDYASGVLTVENIEIDNCQTPAGFGISSMGIISPDDLQIKNISMTNSSFGMDISFANLDQHQPIKINIDSIFLNGCNLKGIIYGNTHIKNINILDTVYTYILNTNYSTSGFMKMDNCTCNMGTIISNDKASVLINSILAKINNVVINGDRSVSQRTPIRVYGNTVATINDVIFNDSNLQSVITSTDFTGILNCTNLKFFKDIGQFDVRIVLDGLPTEVVIANCVYRGGKLHSTLATTPNLLSVKNNTNLKETDITQLNTPYHTAKMQQEGILDKFYNYLDLKTEYDNNLEEIEIKKQQAYEQAKLENLNLTYEEFLSSYPMLLPVEEEPQPDTEILEFAKKYLG